MRDDFMDGGPILIPCFALLSDLDFLLAFPACLPWGGGGWVALPGAIGWGWTAG